LLQETGFTLIGLAFLTGRLVVAEKKTCSVFFFFQFSVRRTKRHCVSVLFLTFPFIRNGMISEQQSVKKKIPLDPETKLMQVRVLD